MSAERDIKWHARTRCYGIDRETITNLRQTHKKCMRDRLPASEVNQLVGAHLRKHGRSTARSIGNACDIFIPDVRQSLARLVDLGVVERDGDIWETSTHTGHRNAAAYAWRKVPGPKTPRGRGRSKKDA